MCLSLCRAAPKGKARFLIDVHEHDLFNNKPVNHPNGEIEWDRTAYFQLRQ